MTLEVWLALAALVLGLVPLVLGRRRLPWLVLAALVLTATTAAGYLSLSGRERAAAAAPTRDLPSRVRARDFVSSDACRACHPGEYDSWHRTYHRSMTQVVSERTVLASFEGQTLQSRGLEYTFERRGDQFWVEMPDPDIELDYMRRNVPPETIGEVPRVWKRIVMSTGSHHQQSYWVPLDDDRSLFQVPFTFLLDERRWLPREDAFLRPPGDDRTPVLWNASCIKCHAVGGVPRLKMGSFHLDTEVADFGIACESCHGPGEEHIEANRDPVRRYRKHFSDGGDDTIVNPKRLPKLESSMVCAQCHSFHEQLDSRAWWTEGDGYRAGDDLRMFRKLSENDTHPGRVWADGTYRVGGREYTGMVESGCFQQGDMTCLSCHSMHGYHDPADQLKPAMDGDQACLQCHDGLRADISAHTHHPPDSSGSRCYNCHMPYTTYALFKGIRNHQIDSPTLLQSVRYGRPNACNLCHLDKTIDWTGEHLAAWYGHDPLVLNDDERTISESVRQVLSGDAVQRAVMAYNMGLETAQETSGREWLAPYLAQLLEDPYSAVRRVSYMSLRTLPGFEDFDYDHLDPKDGGRDAHQRALDIWLGYTAGPERSDRRAVLLDPGGTVSRDVFTRLLSQRDNTPVIVHE